MNEKDVAHTRYAGNCIRDGKRTRLWRVRLFFPGGLRNGHREDQFPVTRIDPRTRYAAFVLLLALLSSLAVAAFRVRTESHANRVEIAMDYTDFVALARSYDYNPAAFLIALRRAGLTSLALTEELGANVADGGKAYATTGAALLNQGRMAPISDPVLAALIAKRRIVPDAVYLLVYDKAAFERYRNVLPLHFDNKSVVLLRGRAPWLFEIRTQIDFFNGTSLGIPSDQIALAKRLGLLVVPRIQNDERFGKPQMERVFDAILRRDRLVSTVIFFGLRNAVFGYPDHLPDAAEVFKEHGAKSPRPFTLGAIETYDDTQIQKGSETLARMIPGQTVRVQAIARTELDKIQIAEALARYELGVRERNVRVVYLRPWLHQDGDLTIEQTNVEFVKTLADGLKAHGFRLGRATPIPLYRGDNRILIGIAALGVPSLFVLLLGYFGWYRRTWAIAAYALAAVLYTGGVLAHHDMLARSVLALLGALLFSAVAVIAIAGAFAEPPAARLRDQIVRSLAWTLLATVVALLGALLVVGLMSSPLAMEEIERFRGVKLVLSLPPLIALLLYLFSGRFASGIERPRDVFGAPVYVYQIFAGIAIVAAGALLVMRSGNQSDLAPTRFELALRHGLGSLLSVRPRLKEFAIGFPALMVLPALSPAHRRAAGWLFAMAIGVGIGDVIDTFSHLHTPLVISAVRVGIGFAIGALAGAVAIALYRKFA